MWKPLDVQALLDQRQAQREATVAANAGAFAVPLGVPVRPVFPAVADDAPNGEFRDVEAWLSEYEDEP